MGASQGCVLSPYLFSIYTNFIQTDDETAKVLEYADNMHFSYSYLQHGIMAFSFYSQRAFQTF